MMFSPQFRGYTSANSSIKSNDTLSIKSNDNSSTNSNNNPSVKSDNDKYKYETSAFILRDMGARSDFKYKTVLKLDPNKNKIYVKFHKNPEISAPALNNDNLHIKVQHNGYDMILYDHAMTDEYYGPATISMEKINNSNNVYVLTFNVNKLLPKCYNCETELPLIKVRDNEYAIYNDLIIIISGSSNPDAKFVTFSTDPL